MRILLLSDIHDNEGMLERILRAEEYDIIVISGDFTYYRDLDYVVGVIERVSRFSDVYFVPGNCDPRGLLATENIGEAKNLHLKIYDVGEFYIGGVGGSNITPFDTRIEFTERQIYEMLEIYRARREILDRLVLVTHVPPYGTLDKLASGVHVGSIELRRFVDEYSPLAVVSGHIHESLGIVEIGDTVIVNPGPVMYGRYALMRISGGKIDVSLRSV